jgi:hypothetical protein
MGNQATATKEPPRGEWSSGAEAKVLVKRLQFSMERAASIALPPSSILPAVVGRARSLHRLLFGAPCRRTKAMCLHKLRCLRGTGTLLVPTRDHNRKIPGPIGLIWRKQVRFDAGNGFRPAGLDCAGVLRHPSLTCSAIGTVPNH